MDHQIMVPVKIKEAFPDKPQYADMLRFRCPGCGTDHFVSVGPRSYWPEHIRWRFNGDYNKPTIRPSVLVTLDVPPDVKLNPDVRRCHSFITDGRSQFLGDCTHPMAGKTVNLPDFEEVSDDDDID